MKESFSIKLYPRPRVNDQTLGKIYIRITANRKKTEIATDHIIKISDWDEQKQRTKNDRALNEELIFIENQLLDIKRQLKYQEKPITSKIVRDIFTGQTKSKRYVLDFFNEYIQYMEGLPNEYSNNLVVHYKCTLNHLREFIKSKSTSDVLLAELDYKFLKDFDTHMLTKVNKQYGRPMVRNTANKQHQRFSRVVKIAVKENLLPSNPYDHFQLKQEKTNREFLNEQELSVLKNHSLGDNLGLQKVRDIFLFSVYTGLRFSDAMALKVNNIWQDKEGNFWFNLEQEKTDEFLGTPLLNPAVEIIKQYDNEERKITGLILPRFSNQKTNAYLKTIAELTGINKALTHHIARHTFATTITLSNNVPLEIVSKMLGHTNIRTTQVYAKITNKYLSEHTSKLNKVLSANEPGDTSMSDQ